MGLERVARVRGERDFLRLAVEAAIDICNQSRQRLACLRRRPAFIFAAECDRLPDAVDVVLAAPDLDAIRRAGRENGAFAVAVLLHAGLLDLGLLWHPNLTKIGGK